MSFRLEDVKGDNYAMSKLFNEFEKVQDKCMILLGNKWWMYYTRFLYRSEFSITNVETTERKKNWLQIWFRKCVDYADDYLATTKTANNYPR